MNQSIACHRNGHKRISCLLGVAIATILLALLCVEIRAQSADIFSLVFANPSGGDVLTGGDVTVDISNASQGYIMIRHAGSSKRLKARITYAGTDYTYDLNGRGEYEAFPLQFGSGSYQVQVFQNTKNTAYSRVYNGSFNASISDQNAAFLCPSQYVWYTPTTHAIAKSFELCDGVEDDMAKAKILYDYVGKNIMYDYVKALSVQAGYLPDIDQTLQTREGICFDYSALLACMLRVQGIPTKLAIGDLVPTGQYHAWNQAYINGVWVLMDSTFYSSSYRKDDYALERFY